MTLSSDVDGVYIRCRWCGRDIEIVVEDGWATITPDSMHVHADCFRRAARAVAHEHARSDGERDIR
jgi:hypothetical protein